MIVKRIEVGFMGVNCYLVGCELTNEALVIDPGDDSDWILEEIRSRGWKVRYIVNTHGHFDHIGANAEVKKCTGAEILIHAVDAAMLTEPTLNLSVMLVHEDVLIAGDPADRTLQDGELIEVGETIKLQVIHTPGHTPGSISLYQSGHLFTGDTLFSYSIGRTDFAGGSFEQIMESIRKLLRYSDETKVYPGHNTLSTIGEIRVQNPYVR